jgi:hypothetical protein
MILQILMCAGGYFVGKLVLAMEWATKTGILASRDPVARVQYSTRDDSAGLIAGLILTSAGIRGRLRILRRASN